MERRERVVPYGFPPKNCFSGRVKAFRDEPGIEAARSLFTALGNQGQCAKQWK